MTRQQKFFINNIIHNLNSKQIMKRKLFSLLAILMMALTAQATDYPTGLTDGQVLYVGDTFTPEVTYRLPNWSINSNIAPVKLVRFNVTPGERPWDRATLEEAADGQYYGFMDNDGDIRTYWDSENNVLVGLGEYAFEATENSDGLIVTKSGANVSFALHEAYNVAVTANSDGAATPSYWATYYNGTTSFTADANTTVYKAAMNGTSSLTLTEVADIPAGNAVILKSSSASITLTPAASTTADLSDNVLKGGTTVTSGNDAYTLSRGSAGTGTVGFYKFNGASLDGSKAHLEIAQSAGARGFIGFGDDNTTAIEAPTTTIIVEDGEIYDLTGRRIEGQPTKKGIYVKNGQKFIVK